MDHYVLDDDGEPVAVDLLTWAAWFQDADRVVLQTHLDRRGRVIEDRRLDVRRRRGGIDVSTVFLGLDHAFNGGPPVLWETMIFGGPLDEAQARYTSKLAALGGHVDAVARVQAIGPRLPRRLKHAITKRHEWDRRMGRREQRALERFARRVEV